jgi:hypothetical protein
MGIPKYINDIVLYFKNLGFQYIIETYVGLPKFSFFNNSALRFSRIGRYIGQTGKSCQILNCYTSTVLNFCLYYANAHMFV